MHGADGGYFVVADVSPLGLGNAMETCRALPETVGVAAIPVPAFVDDVDDPRWVNLARFGFCKRESVIRDALDKLRTHIESLA